MKVEIKTIGEFAQFLLTEDLRIWLIYLSRWFAEENTDWQDC